jgi:hypothetical protein
MIMTTQFWVIGGDYSDADFTCVVDGTLQAFGPFGDYREAMGVWREQSMASRYKALTRFTIVANMPAEAARSLPAMAQAG